MDGISDFNGLHSRKHEDEVHLYAFDILALEGDLRKLPLHVRKTNLTRLLALRPEGIFLRPAKFGLEGRVSKHKDRPCRLEVDGKTSSSHSPPLVARGVE